MHTSTVLAISAALAITATGVSAQIYENDSGGTVRFYGQASPVFQSFDDGVGTTNNLVDNANSNTRFGFFMTQPYGRSTFELRFETALGFVQTSQVSQISRPDAIDWQGTNLRKFEAAWTREFGKFSFGQGSMATDGVTGQDDSGTTIVSTAAIPDGAGSFEFRDGAGALSGITIGRVFSDFDGPRRFRFRYDTPSWSGLTFAVAAGRNVLADDDDSDYYDAAVYWTGEAGAFALSAAAGHQWQDLDQGATERRYSGSVSALHKPTGLNLKIAAGAKADGGSYGYAKVGWLADLTSVGATAFSVDYYGGSDFATNGSASSAIGVSAVQNFDDIGLEAYLGWRSYSYEDPLPATYRDAQSVLAGARYRF